MLRSSRGDFIIEKGMVITMNIDKRSLEALLTLPDDKLMKMLGLVMGKGDLGRSMPPDSVAGLRRALSRVTDGDIARAMELIELYKQGKREK